MGDELSDSLAATTTEDYGGNEGEVSEGVCDSEGYTVLDARTARA